MDPLDVSGNAPFVREAHAVLAQCDSSLVERLTHLRRTIHQEPELGFEEAIATYTPPFGLLRSHSSVRQTKTAARIRAHLDALQCFTYKECIAPSVVADIIGSGERQRGVLENDDGLFCVALRSDMDALDMVEENHALPYLSRCDGKAHMCGHDGHIVMLLGAASLLASFRSRIPSNCRVRLLFQPAEEGPGGALPMCEHGCLDGVDEVYGIHNFPFIPLGHVRVKEGPIMGHITDWEVHVHGRGGHGSAPHVAVDPIAAATDIVQSFHRIVGSAVSSKEAAVLVVTGIHSGTAKNVIPDSCTIFGSLRDFSPVVCAQMKDAMKRIVDAACVAAGPELTATLTFDDMYPVVDNHKHEERRSGQRTGGAGANAEIVSQVASSVVGRENVSDQYLPILASETEDFSYFIQRRPGCFFFLGGREKGRTNSDCHNSSYDFNDKSIAVGVLLWLRLIEHRFQVHLLPSGVSRL